MGSLFSGLGGFELASVRNGIRPVWASDIEPYPIAVTRNHFPNMRHVGSVTEISGAELEPVDIITFGSPCQDLSVAGKQAGIHEGARSSLFFQAIRIIKEMREKDIADGRTGKFIRPRFAVWENVPGAFSSNKGQDFQAVIQAFCNIRGGQSHIVPLPPKGKWLPAGNIVGNGFSLAWRVLDAAGWGVPQRRKRIFLVADFAGERAGEILFNEDRLHGHPAPGGEAGQGTAADAERSAGRSSGGGTVQCLNPWDCESKRQYEIDGVYRTLDAGNGAGGQAHGVVYESKSLLEENWTQRDVKNALRAEPSKSASCVVEKVAAFMGGQGAKAGSIAYADDGSTPTIKSAPSGGNTVPDVVYPINTMVATRGGKDDGRTTFGVGEANDPQFTLGAAHEHAVCYAIEGNVVDREAKQNGMGVSCDQCQTLNGQDKHAVCFQQNQREEVRDMGVASGALSAEPGSHQQNYVCYKQSGFADYEEGVGTLKASGGDVGGVLKASSSRIYDARGNGDGKTIPTLTGDHENRITDYTALCVERKVDE